MIHDGSIGIGVKFTTMLLVSISARDIPAPNGKFQIGSGCLKQQPGELDAKLVTIF
jgi:hypothetical protein